MTDLVGTIGICAHCGYAIQLRRQTWTDDEGRKQAGNWWMHFVSNMFTAHTAEPKLSVSDRLKPDS